MNSPTVQMADHDTQVFINIPEETPWTHFVSMLIHRATCEQCQRDGPAEVTLNVTIEGVPHVAVIALELHRKT